MKEAIGSLEAYLDELGARNVRIERDVHAPGRLPVFMGRKYEIYNARIFRTEYLLLAYKKAGHPTPAQAAKHASIALSALGKAVVFLFDSLPSFERKRFIQRGTSFIVPQRQLYLPMALIDLRERSGDSSRIRSEGRDVLLAPSQALLLFYLQNDNVSNWSMNKWARVLRYSPTTLGRIRRDLEAFGLCEARRRGRALFLSFSGNRSDVWEKAQPLLRNPVRERSHARFTNKADLPLLEAGLSALSRRTALAPGGSPVYAMSSATYRTMTENKTLETYIAGEEDSVVIERWHYNPEIVPHEEQSVDTLSLYLSLRNEGDERIQSALNEMLKGLKW